MKLGPMVTIGGCGYEKSLENVSWLNKEQFVRSSSLYFTLFFLKAALSSKQGLIDLNQHDFIISLSPLLVTTPVTTLHQRLLNIFVF